MIFTSVLSRKSRVFCSYGLRLEKNKKDFKNAKYDKVTEACQNAELFLIYKGNGVNQSGNPAAVSSEYWDLGQWLCVPLFRVVCLYLIFFIYR